MNRSLIYGGENGFCDRVFGFPYNLYYVKLVENLNAFCFLVAPAWSYRKRGGWVDFCLGKRALNVGCRPLVLWVSIFFDLGIGWLVFPALPACLLLVHWVCGEVGRVALWLILAVVYGRENVRSGNWLAYAGGIPLFGL